MEGRWMGWGRRSPAEWINRSLSSRRRGRKCRLIASLLAVVTAGVLLFALARSWDSGAPGPEVMWSRCESVASELNEAFASAETYRPGEGNSLTAFMERSGVLLAGCEPHWDEAGGHAKCPPPFGPPRASWAGNSTWAAPSGVGKVLRPRGVKVKCFFPTEGATVARGDGGCGAITNPSWGLIPGHKGGSMEGFEQAYWRHLESLRGPGATWWDVKCSDWSEEIKLLGRARVLLSEEESCRKMMTSLSPPDLSSNDTGHYPFGKEFAKRAAATAKPYYAALNEWSEKFLGHHFCVDDTPAQEPDRWLYEAPCAWPPSMLAAAAKFQDAIAMSTRSMALSPFWMQGGEEGTGSRTKPFNEFVLRKGGHRAEAKAIYWVNIANVSDSIAGMVPADEPTGDKDVLQLAAWRLARDNPGAPVVVVDPSVSAAEKGRTFQCDKLWRLGLGAPQDGNY